MHKIYSFCFCFILQGPKQGRRARKDIEVDSGPAEDVHEDDTVAAADVPIARDVSTS